MAIKISGSTIIDDSRNIVSAGVVTATKFCGDGSCLTGISAGGFSPDADKNLVAGTSAGASLDGTSGCYNLFLGECAAKSATSSSAGIFLGCESGGSTNAITGNSNVAVGAAAGFCLSSAVCNVLIGRNAGKCMTTSGYNVAIGVDAGCNANPSSAGIFIGKGAGAGSVSANTGHYNIFIGDRAGYKNCAGQSNLFIGRYAGFTNCGGNANIFLGNSSGCGPTANSHCWNTYIGCAAGNDQTDGQRNIIIGCRGSLPVKDASDQIIFTGGYKYPTPPYSYFYGCCNGGCVLTGIGTEYPDTAVGAAITSKLSVGIVSAYKLYGDGSCLTNLPSGGGFSPDADENLITGTGAGASVDGTNACHNIYLGTCAGNANVAGSNNVFLGNQAGRYTVNSSNFAGNIIIGNCAGQKFGCDSGDDPYNNVIIGTSAGRCSNHNSSVMIGKDAGSCSHNTFSQFSTFVGAYAGQKAKGSYNSFFGFAAGRCNNGGSSNVMIGACAGQNQTSGASNVFVGKYSGRQNTGKYNSAFGRNALQCKTAGDCNIALGYNAFRGSASLGHSNVALGSCAGFYQEGDCNVIIGAGVTSANSVTGSGQLAIGIGNTVWLRGDSSFNIYDKDGNQLNGAGGGGGLSYFTESENTSSPNNTVAANRFLATGSGTNIDAVFQPKGEGAFLAQLPDSATAGGNKRGCYSVDLQMIRPAATCVSCGSFASIAGGCGNKAGDCGFVGGGVLNSASYWGSVTGGCSNSANSNWAHVGGGHGNSAGYAGVVAGGQSNNASTYASVLGGMGNKATGYMAAVVGTSGSCANGDCSVAIGYRACNHGRHGSIAIGAGAGIFGSNLAKIQYSIMNIGRDTTDATQTALHAEGSSCSAASDNQLHLKNNSAYLFSGQVIANVTGGGDTHAWEFSGIIKKGTGNVALVGTPNINDIGYDSGASGWSIAVCADTSNASLAVCVTGQASTNIRWGATLRTTEIMH